MTVGFTCQVNSSSPGSPVPDQSLCAFCASSWRPRLRILGLNSAARLDQDAEALPEMLGMRQGLKLPGALRVPLAELRPGFPCFRCKAREKSSLRLQQLRRHPGFDPGLLDAGEVHMRGEVLFTRVGENVSSLLVLAIGAQGSVEPSG